MSIGDVRSNGKRRYSRSQTLIPPLRRLLRETGPTPPWDDASPIRAELFSVERLEDHARSLAAAQMVSLGQRRGAPLARRLADNEAVLMAAYHDTAEAVSTGAAITPAAEWLIDNFYVIERQIREIRADLPPRYYRELPKLAEGPFAGYPRVFGIAWAFVAHTDSLFDPEVLRRFLGAYQEAQPLSIGELWAVAITLRIVLVENLRRIASRIIDSRAGRAAADTLADRLLGVGDTPAEPADAVPPPLDTPRYSSSFLVQLVHRLRDQDPSIAPALTWLDEQLARQGTSAEAVVREEQHRQVSATVTVRNIITSMRFISDVDWTELFEHLTLVDEALSRGTDFRSMDFPTRNLYRSAVEELARGSRLTELQVALAAVNAAARAGARGSSHHGQQRLRDPGYYLVSAGREAFEAEIGYRPSARARLGRDFSALGVGGYIFAHALVGALVLWLFLTLTEQAGAARFWLLPLALVGLAPAVDLGVTLVNAVLTRGYRATLLPALDLHEGVPDRLRTLVVVPTLLISAEGVAAQIERLEVHYLASQPGAVHYALLSDWRDAANEHEVDDQVLLAAATVGIAALNERHGAASAGDRFLLLHRRRQWNSGEKRWMGWERKRGKLSELNGWLRGVTDTSFLDPPSAPDGVRYVITLDADTQLPRDTVGRLIGKMAHPLNQPRYDADAGKVVEGYAIMQPRVTPALQLVHRGSLFQRVFSSAAGIDPYAAAVSDVYQDLFGEGTFTGKGIYVVDAFEASLSGRVPESAVLSHDLFEGVFARAALISDVEVVEAFPARYDVAALRSHRWARGDWQLLPWILGLARTSPDNPRPTRVSALGRLKMLDNLRRSLLAPCLIMAFIAGWLLPLSAATVWTFFVLLVIAVPAALPTVVNLVAPSQSAAPANRWQSTHTELGAAALHTALTVALIAHQAWLMGDAIVRTLVRLVTRRHLLEWVPADQASFALTPNPQGFYAHMSGAVIVALGSLGLSVFLGHGAWPVAGVFAFAWLASPLLAARASLEPSPDADRPITAADARALRLIARQTWRYFETFVTPAEHMLPPDNFQEFPQPVTARRTSPTNIGVYLLSVTSARDLGWIGATEAVERLEATFATMAAMEKFRGHLYNWYGTADLRPLDPPYVSSVDSGNLAGHLLSVANACREWRTASPEAAEEFEGVVDAIALARRALAGLPVQDEPARAALVRIDSDLEGLALALEDAGLGGDVRLADGVRRAATLASATDDALEEDNSPAAADLRFWVGAIVASVASRRRDTEGPSRAALDGRLESVEQVARSMAMEMEFGFLLDPGRLLLSIGYQVRENLRDPNCYDLLASEARLASLIAIAKGDVPARHWFRLGRAVTVIGDGAALISWSGSMFEYLMPSLVIRAPIDSLMEQSNRRVVRIQIDYGAKLGTPWGVSESAYNARDREFTYQYTNFGVPGLGLKRGLANNAVIAPYATALASMIDPEAATRNFERLEALGARGRYGFYEAIDFTANRLPEGTRMSVVRAFMAHHQGMTVTAIADTLLDGVLRRRFHAEPIIQATELLLQERAPREATATKPSVSDTPATALVREVGGPRAWRGATPWGLTPATQLLSNGRYTVMLTAAGSGYSAWRDLAVTRWREDPTSDDWGSFVLLRDVASGRGWSATYQPAGPEPDGYSVVFHEDNAKFERRDGTMTTTLDVAVSAEDDAEVRRVTLLNRGGETREIEVTSYVELVLGPKAADDAHPAFSKMFVMTEDLPAPGALLATRRRRSPSDPEVWAAHLAVYDDAAVGKREFETDRAMFLGRGGGNRGPIGAAHGRPLSGCTGAVLDPVFVLRRRLRIPPGATARVDFWTMVASSREQVLDLIDKHHGTGAFERATSLARTQIQVQLGHLGIDPEAAGQFQRLAAHVIYASPALRVSSDEISRGRGGQPGLWSLGISGDLPIVLVRVSDVDQLGVAREALQAIEYWRMKRLAVDLVILNDRAVSYVQDLHVALETLVRASQSRPQISEERPPGHIFMLRADQISPEAQALLVSVARVVLTGERGSILDHLERTPRGSGPRRTTPQRRSDPVSELRVVRPEQGLEYFNGLGGFAEDGSEYVTILGPGQTTPAPWVNIVANPTFGFQVSAEGGGYAWSVNSREHQLTPWSNDAVTDRPGQALYLRDEETGEFWTPTALPIRDEAATYVSRHGWGYSRFEHTAHGIASDLLEFVPRSDCVKISRLKLHNTTQASRRISVTAYVEWVLGATRAANAPFITTASDPVTHAIFASNAWTPAFGARVAFADLRGMQMSWTADRREFIGRNGGLDLPAALAAGATLSGRAGSGLDPCAALQTIVEIPPGGVTEVDFFLGDGADEADARALIDRYRQSDLDAVLADVRGFWEETTGAIKVATPDRSMDIMLNGWLIYQTLACRVWGRSAFYQASGAYGFRDQLQDGMALATIHPGVTRQHLLRAGGRQFAEGDVQHWWLPHTGQGVRTRISDDRAWLAFAVAHYVRVTGDAGVLDEPLAFLTGPLLKPDEVDNFFLPTASEQQVSLYEHCALALDASLAVGVHGAPLMGAGDWNDGLNRVGAAGRGESVWLGWFLYASLDAFVDIARARGDPQRAEAWRAHMEALETSLDREAWDGAWYKRGWFDDGAALGSAVDDECRIDSIAQAWAVISAAARPDRARAGMEAVERELIRPQEEMTLLFTPPFDQTVLDPGYIKSYPPGIRENGGQYTHAALWSVIAFARLGEGDKAAALFALLNPINHTRTPTDLHRYKVEPYVTAADVYSASGHVGRGGWTWYTGSAAWMQRAGLESILGIGIREGRLWLDPCVPASWPHFEVTLRQGGATYHIRIDNPSGARRGVASAVLDGQVIDARPLWIPLADDRGDHRLEVRLG